MCRHFSIETLIRIIYRGNGLQSFGKYLTLWAKYGSVTGQHWHSKERYIVYCGRTRGSPKRMSWFYLDLSNHYRNNKNKNKQKMKEHKKSIYFCFFLIVGFIFKLVNGPKWLNHMLTQKQGLCLSQAFNWGPWPCLYRMWGDGEWNKFIVHVQHARNRHRQLTCLLNFIPSALTREMGSRAVLRSRRGKVTSPASRGLGLNMQLREHVGEEQRIDWTNRLV